jgi:molybdate transport system substrate-binding protein
LKRVIFILNIIIYSLYFTSCSQKLEQTEKQATRVITVSAAASLKDALSEIGPKFEQEKGIRITFNYGSSGALQKQIEEGAPVDIFISAGKKQMNALESKNLIDKDSRRNLLNNKLVLIVSNEYKDKIKTSSDLVDKDIKIGIGQPSSVPAGQYAKDSLTYQELWDKLKANIVYAKDVKQVVAYVEKGEAAAGIVYKSDAAVLKNSVIAQIFDESSHEPIVYPEVIVTTSKEKEAARDFLNFLNTDNVKQIFVKYNFEISKN